MGSGDARDIDSVLVAIRFWRPPLDIGSDGSSWLITALKLLGVEPVGRIPGKGGRLPRLYGVAYTQVAVVLVQVSHG